MIPCKPAPSSFPNLSKLMATGFYLKLQQTKAILIVLLLRVVFCIWNAEFTEREKQRKRKHRQKQGKIETSSILCLTPRMPAKVRLAGSNQGPKNFCWFSHVAANAPRTSTISCCCPRQGAWFKVEQPELMWMPLWMEHQSLLSYSNFYNNIPLMFFIVINKCFFELRSLQVKCPYPTEQARIIDNNQITK